MKARLVMLLGVALLFGYVGAAQEVGKSGDQAKSAELSPTHFYRLEYTVREMDGSKMLSKRTYSVGLRADNSRREMRTGSRVPVATGSFQPGPGGNGISPLVNTQWQYIDVGVNIDSRAKEEGDALGLEVTADMSSIAAGEGASPNMVNNPVIRQVRGSAAVTVALGKPTIVFAADDPASGHRFELEVVAARVK